MADEKTTSEKIVEIEQYFRAAFCADKATFVTASPSLEVGAIIELACSDGRGTFYVAQMYEKEG